MKFDARQFVQAHNDTPEDKVKFCNQFAKLVENGFRPSDFPKWFYTRLSMTFGHIAHYNQGGFWDAQLENPRRQIAFLEQAAEWPCYGSPAFTYCDAERAIQDWLNENPEHLQHLRAVVSQATEASERAQYEMLKAKYA